MKSKDAHTGENNAKEQELLTITEEMRIAMLEAGKKASQIPVQYQVEEEIPHNFRDYDQAQSFFITVTKQGFIEESHPVVLIDTIIEKLDLTTVYEVYAKEGRPAYQPRMMLKILFYAYFCRIMTSRTIWNNVINRCDFIFLAAGQVPDFRTINNFRKRHLAQLPDIFAQIVMYCRELNMIGYEHLAIDGEKIQANANYTKSKNLEQINKELDRLKNGLQKLLETEVNEYISEVKKEKRINTLEKKIAKLEPLQKQLEQIAEKKKRINLTDPDAPVMRLKDGRSRPSYNHQTARDNKCSVVTAVETSLSGDEPDDLLPLVDQSVRNSGRHHDEVSADSGFCSYINLEKFEERPEDFHVPDRRFVSSNSEPEEGKKYSQEKFHKNEEGDYVCPAGRKMEFAGIIKKPDGGIMDVYECTGCWNCTVKGRCTKANKRQIAIDTREPLREKMRQKLKSEKGREIYMKRQGLIESIHGDDQKNRGWRQHLLRGFKKARGEFLLIRIVQNISCMIKHRSDEILAWVGT